MPDVDVWIALASSKHEHHLVARQWFDSVTDDICFCRVTQVALLRLLTNVRVMEEDVLSPKGALMVYRELICDSRVRLREEPVGVEERWWKLMSNPKVGGSSWTDAYLAAFAMEAGFRLVTFDAGMRKWGGAGLEVLRG